MTEKFLTVQQLAERWGFNERKIYNMANKKEIPATKIGKSWRFPLTLIEEYERTQTTIPDGCMENQQP